MYTYPGSLAELSAQVNPGLTDERDICKPWLSPTIASAEPGSTRRDRGGRVWQREGRERHSCVTEHGTCSYVLRPVTEWKRSVVECEDIDHRKLVRVLT